MWGQRPGQPGGKTALRKIVCDFYTKYILFSYLVCYNKEKAQEVISMKIIVTGKNISVTDKIQAAIDKSLRSWESIFADDIKATVVMHPERPK